MAKTVPSRAHNPFRRIGELFDASALGLVTLLLLVASFYATWRGLGDFVASRAAEASLGQQGLVLLVVFTLTLAMYVALREAVNPIRKRNILPAFFLYGVLALWSVGFGYGFWWSLIAGEDATEIALERTLESYEGASAKLVAEIETAVALVASVEAASEARAERERTEGGTCGVASPAGNGPLSRAREASRAQIAGIAELARTSWLAQTQRDLEALKSLAPDAPSEGETPEQRKERFIATGRKANRWTEEFSARSTLFSTLTGERLRAAVSNLSHRPSGEEPGVCYDPDLAAQLSSVADALDKSYDIEVIAFRYAEGVDGVALAVEDLWMGVFGRLGLVDRAEAKRLRTDGRSLIALMAVIGVDLALFIFALLRGGMRAPVQIVEPPENGGRQPIAVSVSPEGPVDGGVEAPPAVERVERTALPPPARDDGSRGGTSSADTPVRRSRVEADPKAVGIGTTDASSYSQVPEDEQVTDLIRSVDGHYRAMSKDEVIADREAEIDQLKAELAALKRRGYVATGRRDQMFDPALHKQVGTQASDKPEGTIIATVRPGYITGDLNVFRIAYVIVSSGPSDFDF